MKTHWKFLLIALAILTVAPLAQAQRYGGRAVTGTVSGAGAYRGYGYGYGAGLGYGYGYGYNPVIVTTPTTYTPPPPPAPRTTLPAGAAPVVVFGQTYYFADGTYYRAQTSGGTTVYVVANP
jgi:hypothetical protein